MSASVKTRRESAGSPVVAAGALEDVLVSGKSGPTDQVALVTRNPARKPAGCSNPLNSAVKSLVKAPFESCRDLWQPKTSISGLSCMWRCLRDSAFSRFTACDGRKDGQTDRRTHDYDRYHASIASRGKNSHGDCFIWFLSFLSSVAAGTHMAVAGTLALSAGTLMASAGTPYRLVPAHFYPWVRQLIGIWHTNPTTTAG